MDKSLCEGLKIAFNSISGRYGLRSCETSDDDAIVVGNGFALLFWLDRDGLAMWYIDMDNHRNEFIDICGYLATKRKWIVDQSIPKSEDPPRNLERGIASCVRTLTEVAPDILGGDKLWLKDIYAPPQKFSDDYYTMIRSAIDKCLPK